MKNIIIFTASLLLVSCSANWHMKKAIKKDPTLLQIDTLRFTDTVRTITNTISTDSTFVISNDTVTIIKDKLTIKHYITRDSVYIWGECEGDTIIEVRTVEIPIDRWIYPDKMWYEHLPPLWVWLLALGLYIYLKYFNEKEK